MKADNSITCMQDKLAASAFFKGMNPRHLRIMAECAMPAEFTENEIIFREGDVANRFYLIESGTVALESRSRESTPIRIQTVGDGDVLGWSWLFAPYLWHFDARAISDLKAIFIYGSRLRDHCEDDHEFGHDFVMRMSEVIMRRLQATRWQLFQVSEVAINSQSEALNLAAKLGFAEGSGAKHFRPSRHSAHFKPQLAHKK